MKRTIEYYTQVNEEIYKAGGAPFEVVQQAFTAVLGVAPVNMEATGYLVWYTKDFDALPDWEMVEDEITDEFYALMDDFLYTPAGELWAEDFACV